MNREGYRHAKDGGKTWTISVTQMAEETLRTKWTRLVEWVLRSTDQIDTRALYPATVQRSDGNRADVKPDDERLGLQLSNRPVRRPDGFTAVPRPGMRCLIGWDGYREDQSFVLLGYDGNGGIISADLSADLVVDIQAPTVRIGDSTAFSAIVIQPIVPALTTLAIAMGAYATAAGTLVPVLAPPAVVLNAAVGIFTGAIATYTALKAKAK